jgi:hypothetical protein
MLCKLQEIGMYLHWFYVVCCLFSDWVILYLRFQTAGTRTFFDAVSPLRHWYCVEGGTVALLLVVSCV